MKKIIFVMLVLVMALAVTSAVQAAPITFVDTTLFTAAGTNPGGDLVGYGWGNVNKLDGITDWVSWNHNFTFDPAASTVDSGVLTLSLRDDSDTFSWTPELAFGWTEEGGFDFGEVDTQAYGYTVNASYLADGQFQVTLVSAGGDFYIDKSELKVTYTPSAVPEPATMVLLGSGLVGLLGLKRKK